MGKSKIFKYALKSTHLHCKYETKADLDVKKFSCGNWKHFLNILLFYIFTSIASHVYIQTDPAENYTQENGWANGEREENIFNLHTIYLFSPER